MPGFWGKLFQKKCRSDIRCAAVVPAAGSSVRMGQDKLLLSLDEQPVLAHTLRALDCCPYVEEIIVVTRRDLIVPIGQLCQDYAFSKVTKRGWRDPYPFCVSWPAGGKRAPGAGCHSRWRPTSCQPAGAGGGDPACRPVRRGGACSAGEGYD